ncbi:hypothetical protein ACCC92_12345 [Mucilaginibacter sp. Mucisp84]|uniref:hypothetical protein n=1 Tax=Mucilaginibacter sp. Mucisp84 TaxID=3243058 RepID=UPI0039A45C12
MLNSSIITIETETGEREIYISPFLLQSKEPPNLKSGTIEKLYFYNDLNDDAYKATLALEPMRHQFKTDDYILNLGQNFENYYLGSFHIDFKNRRCWQWEGKPNMLTEHDVKNLGENLFNPNVKSRQFTLFTPTRPSDFNTGRLRYKI